MCIKLALIGHNINSIHLWKVGHVGTFAGSANAVKWRFYRSFIENLVTSGRDPATVLDADYARTVARGVFS